jgi:two-component system phosphate regulon sensor histidine kinase PhoR
MMQPETALFVFRPIEPARLFERLAELTDMINHGEGGLSVLQLLVELTQDATGAVGAAFVEYGQSAGRIVAASGELCWALGRPIGPNSPTYRQTLADPAPRQMPIDVLSSEGVRQLRGRGINRMVRAGACSNGMLVGNMQVFFADEDGAADEAQLALIGYLAASAAHLYADRSGLPVHDDGPVVASLADGLAVVGPGGIVRSWNPAAARLTARDARQAVGRPLFFPVPAPGEVLDHQMACGRWIQARSAALAGTDATVVTFRERSDPGAEDGARELFIALTSHELRTPVTVIRGYADTLVEHWDSLDEQTRREAASVVGVRARELARLVDRLLTAATDVAGLGDCALRVPFDLIEVLRGAADELSADVRRSLRLRLPAELPKALGERASLTTVVIELVINACKYSTDRVDVELTAGADAQTVWFRVADRGVGVRPEHVERVFERFWQLEIGDQRRCGGVGLGLYLVRRIVERQRGWVSLRPRDGGGTVAEVRLPRADVSPREA